jgi:hypothetical protein
MYTNPPSTVVICRPHHFRSNPQTMADNSFQLVSVNENLEQLAFSEVTAVIEKLRNLGVTVHVFEDEHRDTPDSVFPNNWLSTHTNGSLVIYPMFNENRRKERRSDITDFLSLNYKVTKVHDYSEYENKGVFLEGTGAMVIDHKCRNVYGTVSKRLDRRLFQIFCNEMDYYPVLFEATDSRKMPVYHTNVLMSVSSSFSLICLSMIRCQIERSYVQKSLLKSGKEVIQLTEDQIHQFAGNALELNNGAENLFVMSESAYTSLTKEQINKVQRHAKIEVFSIPTIEKAGGSIRCMLADIHLQPKV